MPRRLHNMLRLGFSALVVTGGIIAPAVTADAQVAPRSVNQAYAWDRLPGAPGVKAAWAVASLSSGPASNRATAAALCEGCRATAVAMQVVLADATSGAVDVANQALAVTETCRRCRADAYAFQFVVAALGRVELSGRGWAQLQVLARRLVAVVRSGVAPSTMGPRVTSIARRVVNVLQREIRVIGPASRLGRSLALQTPGGRGAFTVRLHRRAAVA